MIIVYEPVCTGFEHANFNALFISAIYNIIKDKILFISEHEHGLLVKERISLFSSDLLLSNIFFEDRDNKVYNSKIQKFFCAYGQYNKLLKRANSLDVKTIILTVTRKYELVIINQLAKNCGIKILMLFHAHLNAIIGSNLYKSYIRKHTCKNVGYIVLSNSIKEAIYMMIPSLALHNQVLSFRNALLLNKILFKKTVDQSKIKFGFIGIATRDKGITQVKNIVTHCQRPNTEFHYCGLLQNNKIKKEIEKIGVLIHGGEKPLSYPEYESAIQNLDYVILLLSSNYYKYRVSGTLWDAINNEKPIIALRTSYIDEVFNEFGDIGYMANDEKDICIIIREISEDFNQTEYNKKVEKIRFMKTKLTPEFIASEFKKQYKMFVNLDIL